jgi:ribulose-phosphate 3-epimerase
MGGKMNQSIRVVPAVLTDDAAALKKMLLQAGTFTDYVQIDIMDNKFVPSRSITWEEIAAIQPKIKWEAHLMVEQPEKQLENFKKAGATKAIFHFEATSNPDDVISTARQLEIGIGVALNPETPVTRITRFIDKVDSVLFLSVHPGFYGAKFIPEVLDKMVELRQQYPEINIGIDGGIKESNIAQIARKGVNEIFVGSAILLQPDPGESYRKLNLLAQTSTGNR